MTASTEATVAASPRPTSIIVVRDGDGKALLVPPPSVFAERSGEVGYFHAGSGGRLPPAGHYVFLCQRADARIRKLLGDAVKTGATVTLVIRFLDETLAARVERSGINLIPTYGGAGQITLDTLRRTLVMALSGERIAARGFLLNSIGRASPASPASTFVRLLNEASAEANARATVVAGVLALQRSGSKFLRDIIGLTVSGRVRIVHEHAVPEQGSIAPDDARPLFEQILLESDLERRRALKLSILRRNLLTSERRYIFVTERDPGDRLISYFQVARAKELRARFDASQGRFSGERDIQAAFDAWARVQIARQRLWYEKQLAEPFGLRVLDTEGTGDGLLVGTSGPNTLIVVPTTRLNGLLADLSANFGAESYKSLADNSARMRGSDALNRCFRQRFKVAESILDEARRIPEVAYIHSVS